MTSLDGEAMKHDPQIPKDKMVYCVILEYFEAILHNHLFINTDS